MSLCEDDASLLHKKYLENACRVCGYYRGQKKKEQFHSLTEQRVASLVSSVFEIDISYDQKNVHPNNLCNNCYAICLNASKDASYSSSVNIISWKKHEIENCTVCAEYLKKLRGGRKRKERKGRGRPKLSKLGNTHKRSDAVCLISADIIPSSIVENMPELNRFISPPQDLVCPICKEILDRPIQSQCQHIFCYACVQEWLNHAGKNSKCPCCLQPLVLSAFSRVPRIILNVLSTLLVLCRSCKKPIALEQLAVHEQQCNTFRCDTESKTLAAVLITPNDVPLSNEEEQAVTHLVKRKLNFSEKPQVLLKTRGTVGVVFNLYMTFLPILFLLSFY